MKKDQLFIYIGPGDKQGEIHQIIHAVATEIITWGAEEMTWRGNLADFNKQFKPYIPTQQ
jgi:hypothetical protein